MGMATRTTPAVLAMLFAAAAEAQDAASVVREGKHFRIEVHADKLPAELVARLADEALAAVEAGWPVLQKSLQPKATTLAIVRLYADIANIPAEVKRLRAEAWDQDTFVPADASAALVYIWPPYSAKVLQQIGLPVPVRRCLVFAAAKLFATKQLGAKADAWLVDVVGLGLLEATLNPRREFGVDGAYDTRRFWIADAQRSGVGTLLTALVSEATPHGRKTGEYFAGRAVLAELLARADSGWASKLLARWRLLEEGSPPTRDRMSVLESVLGKDWPKTQKRFEEMCRPMRPVWQEVQPSIWRDGASWMIAGSSNYHACVYAFAKPATREYCIRGTFRCGDVPPEGAFRVCLDMTYEGMAGVLFRQKEVQIAEWTPKQDWMPRSAAGADLPADQMVDFRIDVTRDKVRVRVDGRDVVEWAFVGERTMGAAWGLSVGDAVVRLDGLVCEPLPAAKK